MTLEEIKRRCDVCGMQYTYGKKECDNSAQVCPAVVPIEVNLPFEPGDPLAPEMAKQRAAAAMIRFATNPDDEDAKKELGEAMEGLNQGD